jgi:hypothetical protein
MPTPALKPAKLLDFAKACGARQAVKTAEAIISFFMVVLSVAMDW